MAGNGAVLPACANCGTALNGPFCSNCGQKAADFHRPIWWILGEFLDAVFSYDSRTFRTIWLLFALPGEFTTRYLAGKRASLLPPFRLFVIASVVFFLMLQVTGLAIVAFKIEKLDGEAYAVDVSSNVKDPAVRKAINDKLKSKTYISIDFFVPASSVQHVKLTEQQKKEMLSNPVTFDGKAETLEEEDWLRWTKSISKRVQRGYERALEDPVSLNGPLNVWLPRLMLVLVPVFALLLALFHWWPRVFLIEHLIFSLHIHTFIFVALALTTLVASVVGDSGFLWGVWLILGVYLWMAMIAVYRRSWWLTSVKFAVVLGVYSLVLTIGLSTIFFIALAEL